jgi:hypothetical protein
MEASYTVNVGDGEQVTMTGNPEKLDQIVELMRKLGPPPAKQPPQIVLGELPERVEFRLTSGVTMAVSHGGDRLNITTLGGSYVLFIQPRASNHIELLSLDIAPNVDFDQSTIELAKNKIIT